VRAIRSTYHPLSSLSAAWPCASNIFPEVTREAIDPDEGPVGCLEAVIDGRAVGWAYDPSAPRRRIALELNIDGERIGRVIADLARPSLADAGIGDGRHAFIVNLPARVHDGSLHTISLVLPTGEQLRVTHPLRVAATDAAPEWSSARLITDGDLAARLAPMGLDARRSESARPAGKQVLRLRSCDEAHFLRRDPSEGFSGTGLPETIFLADHVSIDRPAPLHVGMQPNVCDPKAERELRRGCKLAYVARRPAICRLPRAIVDTAAFLICPDEHLYLHDSVRGPNGFMEWFGYSAGREETWVREVDCIAERDERVVVLGAQTNNNFSHWLLESVARALLFRPFDDGSWSYLTPGLKASWRRQTLELIGLGADRVIEVEPAGLVRFSEVIAVSRGMTRTREFVPAAIHALAALGRSPATRELISGEETPGRDCRRAQGASGQRRLYVSRARSSVRGVDNEPAVVELFERHGFEVVCMETLPFAEQVGLFAEASVVAGPHGAGMTGVVFCSPGALVIELQGEGQRTGAIEYVWSLCAVLGHRFVPVVCRHTPGMEDMPLSHRAVTVDVPHLDRLLWSVLGDPHGSGESDDA
jgi:hypothetical protein